MITEYMAVDHKFQIDGIAMFTDNIVSDFTFVALPQMNAITELDSFVSTLMILSLTNNTLQN